MSEESIPVGWTAERLRSATRAEFETLSIEELLPLISYKRPEILSIVTERLDRKADDAYHAQRQELGLPPIPPEVARNRLPADPFVQVVEREGLDEFGFVAIRTDYSDDARYLAYSDCLDEAIERSMDSSTGAERVRSKMVIVHSDNVEKPPTTSYEDAVASFVATRDVGEVPPGHDLSMCLIADRDAIDSLMDPTPGQLPYLTALDLYFDHSTADHAALVASGEYPGYFKVAVEALIPEFYPMLVAMPPEELWPFAKPIFETAFPAY